MIEKVFWDSPMTLFARLKSDGNVHYKAGGEMRVDKFGKKLAIVKINDEIMYPGKTRIFTRQVLFGPWDYGVYSASLSMFSEDGTIIFDGEISMFFVIPWKTTAMTLGGILLGVLSIEWLRKKFKIIKNDKKTKKD